VDQRDQRLVVPGPREPEPLPHGSVLRDPMPPPLSFELQDRQVGVGKPDLPPASTLAPGSDTSSNQGNSPRVTCASATRVTPRIVAPIRIGTLRSSAIPSTSTYARSMIRRSFMFTSSSSQKYAWRSCTHSKYETVTPPEFARMSGTSRIPRSSRILS